MLPLGDHRAIIDALLQHDRKAAETSLRKHLGRSYRGLALDRKAEPSPKAARTGNQK
jgi:DNA-binding GntR family transcriptional regulator